MKIRIRKYLCMALHTLGYVDLNDLLITVFALKTKAVAFYSISFIIAGFLTFISHLTQFTSAYVYSPPMGIMLLAIASAADFSIGVWHSAEVKKIPFNSWRIPRTFVRFGIQTLLIGIFFNMNVLWPYIIQSWIVTGMLIVFIITTAWSIIENSRDLGFITKHQYELIEGFVNIKNLINRFKSKNDEKEN